MAVRHRSEMLKQPGVVMAVVLDPVCTADFC
jgi:hypothetical protein